MKTMRHNIFKLLIGTAIGVIIIISCKTNEMVANKSGAQLWGENCTRCHYVPSPAILSDQQWDLVGTHMQIRANLTQVEKDQIVSFLQTAN
jgi:hypothetical protein